MYRLPPLTPFSAPRNRPLPPEVYSTVGSAVLLTVRAYRGQPFKGNDLLCQVVVDYLSAMRGEYGCWVGAYCLMPDHLHLVSGPISEGCSVLQFLHRFKGKTTNASWTCGWTGRLWQSRSHDHVIRRAEALQDIYAYILENPVRAGLVEPADDWPWSGVLDSEKG
jgi:REP element-mobilizing transposase RayT